ncbi:shugoshin 2 [Trichomycterus rosablanca]|uniref:shugoshin 2 n=1 Tax=Trichomycterus rosablanca TaxID=2290929 RepID=UPI002F34FC1F
MALTMMMERKPNSIKHTAAKIKTKIHNTSSFFKLSLKTNNKALALALAAQKQKTRQLETETVRLQKDVQSLNFDLAIQRHKNKQMFTVLREFYNNSINCMAKAVDLISKEESAESLDTENTEDACQIEKDLSAVFPERRKTSPLKRVQQEEVKTSRVNVFMVHDNQPHQSSPISKENPPSLETDHTAPQNTMYDSEMEITVVDTAAEIVTVQTKPRRHCENDEEEREDNRKISRSSSSRTASIVACNMESAEESCHLKDVTVIDSAETQLQESMSLCTSVCSSKNESLPQQPEPSYVPRESVTARRKTYGTSRSTKSNKRCNSQKITAGFSDPRKTYVVTPLSSNSISNSSDLDDFFSDTEVQSQRKSKNISSDGNFCKEKCIKVETETEKLQNEGTNLRKTFVVPDRSKPKRSRKTKVSSFHMDLFQDELHEQESAVLIDASSIDDTGSTTVPILLNDFKEISIHKEKPKSKRSTRGHQPNTMKSRATYVVSTSQNILCNDIVNETIDIHAEDTADNVLLENKLTEEQQVEQDDSCMARNRSFSDNSMAVKEKHTENVSEMSTAGHIKPKKLKTGEIKKVKKKNVTTRENAPGKRRGPKCSSTQNDMPTKIPVLSSSLKENCTSTNSSQLPLEESHCSAFEGGFVNESSPESEKTTTVHSRIFNLNKDWGTSYDTKVTSKAANPRHSRQTNTQDLKSKCRGTFVVMPSSNLPLTEKENTAPLNNSFEENEECETSRLSDRMFVPNQSHDSQSTPRKTDRLGQTQSELFDEERPPWESLDFGFSGSPTCYSPVNDDRESQATSQRRLDISQTMDTSHTMDIYEEPGYDTTHQSPVGRAMKSLTNTDLTAPGRTRRKAALVSYREPPLNCKMRRGDKYSDTRFLSSPVFKDKKKRLKKNKNELPIY